MFLPPCPLLVASHTKSTGAGGEKRAHSSHCLRAPYFELLVCLHRPFLQLEVVERLVITGSGGFVGAFGGALRRNWGFR